MVKKDLNISLATKILKKIDFYLYFSQKPVHIEETLMKLNIFINIFFDKRWLIIWKKKNEIREKFKNILKKEFGSEPVYNENI